MRLTKIALIGACVATIEGVFAYTHGYRVTAIILAFCLVFAAVCALLLFREACKRTGRQRSAEEFEKFTSLSHRSSID